jgi:hypothetical protein
VPELNALAPLCQNSGRPRSPRGYLLKSLAFHLEFHLQYFFKTLCVTLPEELGHPLVSDAERSQKARRASA